jgi:hypothetical protein
MLRHTHTHKTTYTLYDFFNKNYVIIEKITKTTFNFKRMFARSKMHAVADGWSHSSGTPENVKEKYSNRDASLFLLRDR